MKFILCRGRLYFFAYILITNLAMGCKTTTSSSQNHPQSPIDTVIEKQIRIINSQIDRGAPREAIGSLRPLLRKFPARPEVQTAAGLTHLALSNNSKSLEHFGKAWKLEKTAANGLNLSSAYLVSKQFSKAVKLLTHIRKQFPTYPFPERVLHNLGLAQLGLKKYRSAIKSFQEALTENPTYYLSHMELAELFKKTKKWEQAEKSWLRASQYCESCFDPVHKLSVLYLARNRHSEATRILKNFLNQQDIKPRWKKKARSLLRLSLKQTEPRTSPRGSIKPG